MMAALITLSALFSYLNHRLLGLPPTIGVMALSLAFSLGLVALARLGLGGERLSAVTRRGVAL